MWTVEYKRDGKKWIFSAAYPTLKEARTWVAYMQPELVKRVRKWVPALLLLLFASWSLPACSDTCGRIEGPSLVVGESPTGCWRYTGEPKCAPALADEGPCAEPREQFRSGAKLVLWCDPEVVAPKAVMVPVDCEASE
jgi:hypothetical protein